MMVERGMIPAWATVAVDMTAKPYSGKKRDEIARGGKSKGGTSWFETFATAVIASRPYLPHIGIRPVRAGDAVDKCVQGAAAGLPALWHLDPPPPARPRVLLGPR